MRVSINDQFHAFAEGRYMNSEGHASWCFNFYDWFCEDAKLEEKADTLYPAMMRFCRKMGLDTSRYFCFFKNNCPTFDNLYDDFRICDRETGDVVFTVIPDRVHHNGHKRASIWGIYNGFDGPIAQGESMREIYESEAFESLRTGWAEYENASNTVITK